LSRTSATASNRKTFTWSGWVKRGALSTNSVLFSAGLVSGTYFYSRLYFDSSNNLVFINYPDTASIQATTAGVFRDPAAWYHIACAVDTTQATNSNGVKIWINGVQQTLTFANYTQNADTMFNTTSYTDWVGKFVTGAANDYFDGYMAEINFIDGQALAPTAFGTFNSYGVWQPITYGGSYGTNGFRLPFTNNASTTTLGYDFSPQGNNWTTNNISVTAGATYDSMTDVPTLTSATAANYAVLNPLDKGTSIAVANGNLNPSIGSAAWQTIRATMAFPTTGKWYIEAQLVALVGGAMIGIGTDVATLANYAGVDAFGWSYNSAGQKFNAASGSAYGAAFAPGDVLGVAFDSSAGTLTFYKNNVSQGVAYSGLSSGPYFLMPSVNVSEWAINFGQQPFVYTPPSGFLALNTFNL
jgi:hypothetical protein